MRTYVKTDYNTSYAIKIEITSNTDDYAHYAHSLFGAEKAWELDTDAGQYFNDCEHIFNDLFDKAFELADTVSVSQLRALANDAHENGYSMLELFDKSYDDGFFVATIAIEAIDEDTF